MDAGAVLDTLGQCGYLALFVSIFIGIFASPVPDEVLVMSAGLAGSMGIFNPLMAFLIAYAALTLALTLTYFLGRYLNHAVEKYKPNRLQDVKKARRLVDRYGSSALIFSYFVPMVRHLVPYLAGMNGISFGRYVRYSYTAGLLWTILYFLCGSFCGEYIDTIGNVLSEYTWLIALSAIILGLLFIGLRSIWENGSILAGRGSHS